MAEQDSPQSNPEREPAAPAAGAPPSDVAAPPRQDGVDAVPPAPSADGGATPDEPEKPATVLDEGAEPEKPVEHPAELPANWRDIVAAGDDKLRQRLNRFGSLNAFAKSWLAAQQKISSGEHQRPKPDESDPQALEQWRAEVGIPAKPEGYLEKLPDGLVVGEEDQQLVESFLERAHGKDVAPSVVHDFLAWHQDQREKLAAEIVQGDNADRASAEDALRPEWGAEYRANINSVTNLVSAHGTPELLQAMAGARCDDGVLLGNKPEFWRLMVGIDKDMNPHGTVVPAAGQTPLQTIDARLAELETEMQDSKGRDPKGYWSNPAKQKEYHNLLEQKGRYERRSA